MRDALIADTIIALAMFVVVPGILLFIAGIYVEAMDAIDSMERKGEGCRNPQGKE